MGIENVKQEKFNQRTKIVTCNRENLLSAKVTTMNFASLFSLLPWRELKSVTTNFLPMKLPGYRKRDVC